MSQHSAPIVETILFVADQRHPWKLAALSRLEATYHTPTTVRARPTPTRDSATYMQHHVYCIADDAAWGRVLFAWSALQTDLNALADGLRALGSYAKRLSEAGGIKTAPNPLCPTVIRAPDPDTADEGYWFTGRLIPRIERELDITSHTPKMLHVERDGKPWSTTHQRDHFVCPDDVAWARIEALIAAANARALDWATLLIELGTYSEALADGRYAQKEEPTVATTTTAHAGIWHNLPPKLAGWRWAEQTNSNYPPPARLHAPDGWATDEHSTSNQAIAEGLRRMNRAPAGALTVAEPAGTLSTALQDCARAYVAARERAGAALLEMAQALAKARSLAKHGEWYTFLEATQTSEDQADRLLDIDRKASENPEYADAVRRNFLSPTTAALLARPSTPAAVVEQVIRQPTPSTTRQVEQRIQQARGVEPKPRSAAGNAPTLHPDYQQMVEVERILKEAANQGERTGTRLYQAAYDAARQIRDVTLYNRAFATIDRAIDGQAAAEPTKPTSPEVATPTPRAAARTFVTQQRAALAKWSRSAMVSQAAYRVALDHIDALLRLCDAQ